MPKSKKKNYIKVIDEQFIVPNKVVGLLNLKLGNMKTVL
jgi:hypothetical protein